MPFCCGLFLGDETEPEDAVCIHDPTVKKQQSQKMPFISTNPPVKKANKPDPQVWLVCNIKNILSAEYIQSEAEDLSNHQFSFLPKNSTSLPMNCISSSN